MRTIIDIPQQDIQQLDEIKAAEGVSRNELVKRGVAMLLASYAKPQVDGFGLWCKTDIDVEQCDGLIYQQNIRDEW
jgi:hypothetical protein